MALDLARHEVAGDDAARLAVDEHDVEHLVAVVHHDVALVDLLLQGGVGADEQLLAGGPSIGDLLAKALLAGEIRDGDTVLVDLSDRKDGLTVGRG